MRGDHLNILPFQEPHIPQAAALFVQSFKTLRRSQPILPNLMEDPQRVSEKLSWLVMTHAGVVAMEGDILIGYLGWFLVDGFRGTHRKGAYCPVWGHGAADIARPAIYRAMYQAATQQWAAAQCGVYTITLLADDSEIENTWFWNGFGLSGVDAIRSMDPVSDAIPEGFSVRRANLNDIETLAELEVELWQHFPQPPVSMVPGSSRDEDSLVTFLHAHVDNNYWLAEQDGAAIGIMRFEGEAFGASETVSAKTTTAITGAFVRPAYRGGEVAVELLDTALRYYAGRGFVRCSVDFESFNPQARGFWMKYFKPVCFSLARVPEYVAPAEDSDS